MSQGPIIRISPNELHIHDPSFFNELYRQEGRWDKYEFSMQAFALPGAAVFTADHDIHKRRRTPLNPFLAKPAVNKRMDLIQGKMDKFRALLDGYASSQSVLHLGNAYSALTIDIATVFIMGAGFDSLSHPNFNAGMTRALQGAGDLWRTSKHITFLGHLMRLIPLKYVAKFADPDVQAYLGFMEVWCNGRASLSR
jgi:cytochrome P450